MIDISERAFEDAIETSLSQSGYRKVSAERYDQDLDLIPDEVMSFLQSTQIQQWNRLTEQYQERSREQILKRLSSEIERRGSLDVLRKGIKDRGSKVRLAYFQPSSRLNNEIQQLYNANHFSVVRQLRYSKNSNKSLDLALFLNGIPIFTAELKNPLTGQDVQDAIRQYKLDRDPRESLFAYRKCLAHFAVDPNLVYVTTHLQGINTRFLPFNRGHEHGAGNPPVPLTQNGYPTSYLWEETWSRDSVLELVSRFIYEVQEVNELGRMTNKPFLIFPRYHQLDCVQKLVKEAQDNGTGHSYLIQHSAGSGKTYTIAWLAHRLATLHNRYDERVFNSIVVITDRRVLDRQLQTAMSHFEQTSGVVENIDKTAQQLKAALESGKTIIVTTLQKFPVIVQQIGNLPGHRFALIVDEAHSSQSGESAKSLKAVLTTSSLYDAEVEESRATTLEEELDRILIEEMERRGQLPNVSTFAFTATPKPKTLELFGNKQQDGSFSPFHRYSMRQAIEEGFILDVLTLYTTYQSYWRLIKLVEDDPHYDKTKAAYLLKQFVHLNPHAINKKIDIMIEHFQTIVQSKIGGKAKAMIVTSSRLHAVRYKLAIDKYLIEKGYQFKALVAFSGMVEDSGQSYTEASMNGLPEAQTAKTFEQTEYRFLIVANKFQTGFDQPLLHTMYIDKKLEGVNAVQTLSRLNRIHPDKEDAVVLDFVNDADTIKSAFDPYYLTAILSEETDPNLLYEAQTRIEDYHIFTEDELKHFAIVLFLRSDATLGQLNAALRPIVDRFKELCENDRQDFRKQVTDYVRLYAFLSQILTFTDSELENLYTFCRHLRRLLPGGQDELPREVQQNIDMESYRLQQTGAGRIDLDRGVNELDPMKTKMVEVPLEEMEYLSRIIAELNQRFGIDLSPEHRVTLEHMMDRLEEDHALKHAVRANTLENIRLTFNHKVLEIIQEIVDTNHDLYKRITDDPQFGDIFKELLFDLYMKSRSPASINRR